MRYVTNEQRRRRTLFKPTRRADGGMPPTYETMHQFMTLKGLPVLDVMIIGAGVIWTAIIRELSKYRLQTAIFEKNLQVAQETSAGNSGVIHGGFDPSPFLGRHIYENEWFNQLAFPRLKVDSLVLAFNDLETHEIERLYNQGNANGLKKNELQILNRDQCLNLEPNVNPQIRAALLCTGSHIVDPVCLTKN
jgi:glycerol-3-phosphate dehydrogenase